MFNLENAIQAWRRSLAQAGLSLEVIEELEAHLRDEVEEQMRAVCDPEAAFDRAIRLLGDVAQLRDEFGRLAGADRKPGRRFMKAACFVSAGVIAAINAWTLVLFDLSGTERLLGALAVCATALYLIVLPFLERALSIAAYRRFIGILKIAVNLVALFPVILLLSLIGVIELESQPILTLIVWLAFAAAALSVFAINFGRDGWGGTTAGGASGPFGSTPGSSPDGGQADSPIPASKLESPRLLENARDEALRLGHDFIGTEHVLLALLKEHQGEWISGAFKTNYESARAEIERLVGPQEPQIISRHLTLTPRARKALRLAGREAKRMKQPLVTLDHVLSGLIFEGEGVAAKVLNKVRVRPERA